MPFDRNEARDRIVQAALSHVPFDGWTSQVLATAAEEAGYPAATTLRVFPGGAIDAIAHWTAMADQSMIAAIEAEGDAFRALKIREKIARAIRLRLEPLAGHREAVRRALALLAMPQNVPVSLRTGWATVDAIWYAAGDRATDFNYYTKRALAGGVYSATLLYWLEDKSESQADTWNFLDRRIANVMALPKAFGGIKSKLEAAASPLKPIFARFKKAS
jgi:ubiquinone biosynthesis protein COQ9